MKSSFNGIFLKRCFQKNRLLFFILLLSIGFFVYGHKTGCEITPFFVFGMYSGKRIVTKDSFLVIKVNDSALLNLMHTLDEPRRMMIFSTAEAYHLGAINNFEDPQESAVARIVQKHPYMGIISKKAFCRAADYKGYLPWLLHYLQTSVDKGIQKIDIYMTYIHYNSGNMPVSDSIIHLYAFEQNNFK